MDLPSHLVPIFWTAVAVLGVSLLVLIGCLNVLTDAHKPIALRVVWVAGGLFVSSAIIVIMLLVNAR
jgi:hypothetical protein